MNSFPRICLSSTRGGGGKTLLALGLARAFVKQGIVVKPFKKGPDYIDAAWLGKACGIPATNLDTYFLPGARCRDLFQEAMTGVSADSAPILGLVEGNRGLYDGMDACGIVSTATLARVLSCPILLCVDCSKSTRTMAAVLKGLAAFEDDLIFGGVILNKVGSSRHEKSLIEAISQHTDLRVLGALPRMEKNPLPERHMGLASRGVELAENLDKLLDDLGEFVGGNVDLGAIYEIGQNAPPLPGQKIAEIKCAEYVVPLTRIGYVLDKSLWFYYPENLAALAAAGVEPVKLSLFDRSESNFSSWQNLDGLYLGGGFPEDFAPEIGNSPFIGQIATMAENGMPIYAECGGLILLCRSLQREGFEWPMAGVFPAIAQWHARPCGLGYVAGTIARENPFFPLGMELRGHEFHYSCCQFPQAQPACSLKLSRGVGLASENGHNWDGLLKKNVWAAYTHIFAPAIPCWAENFRKAGQAYRQGKTVPIAEG